MQGERFLAQLGAVALVALAAGSCVDRAPTALREEWAHRAKFSIAPSLPSIPSGGPTIPLSKVHGVLQSPAGESVTADAVFVDGLATLVFDVQLTTAVDFGLDLTALDNQNVAVFHSHSTVHVVPGQSTTPTPTALVYSAPDAAVQSIKATPTPLNLDAGTSAQASVTGTGANGQVITPVRVGWTTRDPTIATVDDDGTVHAGAFQGKTWIVARTANNIADSIPVNVHAPVAKIVFVPAAVTVIRGKTAPVAVQLFDSGDHAIDDRTATITMTDQTKATFANGVVTGVAVGATTLTASVEGKSATAAVTVVSPVDHIDLTPGTITLASINQSQNLTATVVARAGGTVDGLTPTFTSSNPAVATADAAGKVVAKANGSTTITASIDDISATATVTVKQVIATVSVAPAAATVADIGLTQQFTALAADALGSAVSVAPADVTWSVGSASIATISASGLATGVAVGTTSVTATAGGKSSNAQLTVQQVLRQLTLNLATAEKLPNGTQQFSVTSGNPGPYSWSVNGIDGGNSTYGTITADGLYIAPAAVPTPDHFDVCARRQSSPTERGCATVTIKPVPTSGADIIVFNDINFVDYGAGGVAGDTTNNPFFRNLINFTGSGPRAAQSSFLIYRGNGSKCQQETYCLATNWEVLLRNAVVGAGFNVIDQSDPSARLTGGIAANVKAIMLLNPTVPFSNAEINVLKQFAGDGGRVIFVGEHYAYYGSYINPVENDFLMKMGAVLRNPGANGVHAGNGIYASPGTVTGSGIKPHQLTTGITGVAFYASSEVELGPNDYAILTYFDQGADRILVAAAKIDLTPLPPDGGQNRIPLTLRSGQQSTPMPPSTSPTGAAVPGSRPPSP